MPLLVDTAAREIALRKSALPECLHIPVAAVDEDAITNYIGAIERILSNAPSGQALLVRTPTATDIDHRLPIARHPRSAILHAQLQVWVDIRCHAYRAAYKRAFPEEDIADKVLSHAANRRMAKERGFRFVRITPISASANSSSAHSEQWGIKLYREKQILQPQAMPSTSIRYADLAEILLMLDTKLGGGHMDAINEGQALVRPA